MQRFVVQVEQEVPPAEHVACSAAVRLLRQPRLRVLVEAEKSVAHVVQWSTVSMAEGFVVQWPSTVDWQEKHSR